MSQLDKILLAFETHSPELIAECFRNGIDPNLTVGEQPLIYSLVNMYTRGPRFSECISVFVDHGVEFSDKALLAVLQDDATTLKVMLNADPSLLTKRYTLQCTFTPLFECSLLHICAEYNQLACANILIEAGAGIHDKAGVDENGFGGQTPIFHTVNQDGNKSADVLRLLLSQHADLDFTIKGLIWGKGYDWETFVPAVNPISYAMMGLLRQFQRTEENVYSIVSLLLRAKYGMEYTAPNIPNKYLLG